MVTLTFGNFCNCCNFDARNSENRTRPENPETVGSDGGGSAHFAILPNARYKSYKSYQKLNKLPKVNGPTMAENLTIEKMSEHFCYNNELDDESIPITYREIKQHQQTDEQLRKMLEYPDPIVKTKYFLDISSTYEFSSFFGKKFHFGSKTNDFWLFSRLIIVFWL